MAKLNNVEIHFKHSNRTYNTMTAFLVMGTVYLKLKFWLVLPLTMYLSHVIFLH